MAFNVLEGMKYVADGYREGQARGKQNHFAQLAAGAYGADDPEARAQLLQQAVGLDATAGMALGKQLDTRDDDIAAKAAGLARYVVAARERGDMAAANGAYQAGIPFLTRIGAAHGKVPPPNFSDDMLPILHGIIASASGGSGDDLKSVRVGANGNFWAIKNGQMVDTGVASDPRTQLRDQPGMEPGLVNLRDGSVRGLSAPGAPQQAPPQPQAPLTENGAPVSIDPSLPPNVQAEIRASIAAGQPVPSTINGPAAMPSAPQSGLTAMRPAISPAEQQRLSIASEGNQRAAEASQRATEAERRAQEAAHRAALGNPGPGQRFNASGQLEEIPGYKAAGAGTSDGERKAATLLKRLDFSLGQLNSVVSADASAAAPTMGASVAGSLPFVGDMARNAVNSSSRQQVEAAQLDILDSALTLGTGAAYTKEQLEGYRRSYFPQLNDSKENIAAKAARLKNVLEAARIAAGRSAPPQGAAAPAAQPQAGAVRRATNPKTGEVVELRNGQWVPVR